MGRSADEKANHSLFDDLFGYQIGNNVSEHGKSPPTLILEQFSKKEIIVGIASG